MAAPSTPELIHHRMTRHGDSSERPGARRAEAWSAPSELWLALEPRQVDALVEERLIVLVE
ncbi:MAG: hypothetical protein Q8S33_01330 [Myxococcales bacterium]|nr:hypothetical protein [Myxococcales bacterium]